MNIMAFQVSDRGGLIAMAYNRSRGVVGPSSIRRSKVRVLCPSDRLTGGTWIGVNDKGLVVSCINRKGHPGAAPENLCREILASSGITNAVRRAMAYIRGVACCTIVIANNKRVVTVNNAGGLAKQALARPGVHVVADGPMNDVTSRKVTWLRGWLEDHESKTYGDINADHHGPISVFTSSPEVQGRAVCFLAESRSALQMPRFRDPETVSTIFISLTDPITYEDSVCKVDSSNDFRLLLGIPTYTDLKHSHIAKLENRKRLTLG